MVSEWGTHTMDNEVKDLYLYFMSKTILLPVMVSINPDLEFTAEICEDKTRCSLRIN